MRKPRAVTAERADAAERPGTVPAVTLEGLEKRFGEVLAVAGVDLEIADGEFFSMLGPSGDPAMITRMYSTPAGAPPARQASPPVQQPHLLGTRPPRGTRLP